MLGKIKIIGEVDQSKLEKICKKLRNLKSRPDGTYELICDLERTHEAISYCNDRIMWLGWQLEKQGIHIKWSC